MGDVSMNEMDIHHPSPITHYKAVQAGCSGGAGWMLLAALALLVAGCGFHLRGSLGEIKTLPPVLLRGEPSLIRDLGQALRSAGTAVVADQAQAKLIVTVLNVKRDQRVLSVGSAGKVAEYELHYSARFRVDGVAGKNLLPEQAVSVVRSFTYDPSDVNAKSNEQENLLADMQRDAVRQILMRLQVVEPPAPQDGAEVSP